MSNTSEVVLSPSRLPAAVRAMRPRQWIKNVLVVTAPLAAGRLFESDVLLNTALAFVAFCLVSATVYLINDVRDVDEDRLHPRKRFRPIAAGELRPAAALVLAGIVGALVAVPILAFAKSFVQYLRGAPEPAAVRFRWSNPRHRELSAATADPAASRPQT